MVLGVCIWFREGFGLEWVLTHFFFTSSLTAGLRKQREFVLDSPSSSIPRGEAILSLSLSVTTFVFSLPELTTTPATQRIHL